MMRVTAEMPNAQRSDGFLATVAVSSDNAKVVIYDAPLNNISQQICRTIVGKISDKGPLWADFFTFYRDFGKQTEQRIEYRIPLLQIDHDVYTLSANIVLNNETLAIIVHETFSGDVDKYNDLVSSRNRTVEDYLRRLDKGQFTRNEIRQLLGESSRVEAYYNEMMPAEEYLMCKKSVRQEAINKNYTRTILH